jgi:hypothetical protein
MNGRKVLRVFKFIVFAVVAAVALSWVVMSLWNWVMPATFTLHRITWLQAFGLLLLSKILFGGFRGFHGPRARWKERMMERYVQMTPEEREKFVAGMGRCGIFGRRAPEAKA